MDGVQAQYLVGLFFVGWGIDDKPNWFKIVFGAILIAAAFLGLTLSR